MKSFVLFSGLFFCTHCSQAQKSDLPVTPVQLKVADEEVVFTKAEVAPTFPGGDSAWIKYLEKSMAGFNPADQGAPKGKYIVVIRFVVKKDGSVHDIRTDTNFGFNMEQEAIKIITNGPKWIPAVQNGFIVNCYRTQPFTFVVE